MKPTKLEELRETWERIERVEVEALRTRNEASRTLERAMEATNRAYAAYAKERDNDNHE